ncbi:MAG: hypothetical protein DRN90_07400 [Thermoproteota archaeon]|nr:MAG: hypothetical protein DRN90_07400 [Candidatus Korarchaeota archaeon]
MINKLNSDFRTNGPYIRMCYEDWQLYRLDEDGKLSEGERFFMDFLFDIPNKNELVKGVLNDGFSELEEEAMKYLISLDRELAEKYLIKGVDENVLELLKIASSLEDKEFARWLMEEVAEKYLVYGVNENVLELVKIASSLEEKEFVEWLLERRFGLGFGGIDKLEREFIENPNNSEIINKLFEHYMQWLRDINPKIAEEVEKLPDYRDDIDAKEIEALEDLIVAVNIPAYSETFKKMLQEGIPERRRYCTPLEAAIWIFEDEEPEDVRFLKGHYDIFTFITYAWRNTTTSDNYQSDKWDEFEEVVDRLNSPILLCIWWKDNMRYKYDGRVSHPRDVFYKKYGECADAATFAAYVLEKNGYDAKVMRMLDDIGHAVCCVKLEDGLYVVDQGWFGGPFSSYNEILQWYGYPRFGGVYSWSEYFSRW